MFPIAGTQTPSDMIGNTVRLALEHRAEGRAMAADPSRAAAFVTETPRLDPPVHILTRVAACDLDLHGKCRSKWRYPPCSAGSPGC